LLPRKQHAADDDFVVVEHMDMGSGAEPLQLSEGTVEAAAVELVVAEHVDHKLVEAQGPARRLSRAGDVSRQDHQIGIVARPVHATDAEV
jgi:hypothetical protein